MELHVRNAYSVHQGESAPDFADSLSIPDDIGEKVLEHHDVPDGFSEEREAPTSTGDLRTDVANAYESIH